MMSAAMPSAVVSASSMVSPASVVSPSSVASRQGSRARDEKRRGRHPDDRQISKDIHNFDLV
jgi:hypothetical protein